MRRTSVLLLLAVAVLVHSDEALPCSCGGNSVAGQDALPVYSAVFLGYVTNIRLLTSERPARENEYLFDDQAKVTFRVRRAWKGVQQTFVTVVTATQVPACGYPFQVGQYYLVYAELGADGRELRCSFCSPTKELSQAAQELAGLGPPKFQAELKEHHEQPGT